MGFPVKMGKIREMIDLRTNETNAFLNKRTGEIVTILAEEFNPAANQEPLQNSPEWERADKRVA